jgi:crotonobetaine/carnitine-CoA ligase
LARNAAEWPESALASFENGTTWTNREALEQACSAANVLRTRGVCQGDHVALFLPNGADFLRAWWGCCLLGAVVVPVNLAYRGAILAHLLDLAEPSLVIIDGPEREHRLDEVCSRITRLPAAGLAGAEHTLPPLERDLGPWDTHALILTSGTTGPSKLSRCTYTLTYLGFAYLDDWECNAEDTYLIDLPLFHLAAIYLTVRALSTRARIAVRRGPAMSTYWEVARDTGATVAVAISTMLSFLMAQPPRTAETEHRLRYLVGSPVPRALPEFCRRFGIDAFITQYGSTEVPCCIVRTREANMLPGYCGRIRPGFDCRIVDADDIEVEQGEVGELIVRTEHPWMLTDGYVRNAEATTRVWRNGWFHTGDLFRRDVAGDYFFIDRSKDAIRRRGENISSFEVEAQVGAYPGIEEVACVPERSDVEAEDEVKVWIVTRDPRLEIPDLVRYLTDRMPGFMVPRYYETADELPKTHTNRIRKAELRARGNGPETWDREVNGRLLTPGRAPSPARKVISNRAGWS